MKKYTKPEVEITAFDFEDITMSSLGFGVTDATVNNFKAETAGSAVVIDARDIAW